MNYFYFKEISEGYITLDEDESKHLQQVLRQKSGNLVHLLNGNGLKAEGYIFSSNKKTVSVKLEKTDFIPKKNTDCILLLVQQNKWNGLNGF